MALTEPLIKCPCCGSLWTKKTHIGGAWKCNYCNGIFPVEHGGEGK